VSGLRLLDEIVVMVVGDEERVFAMHKGLLCSVSDYFAAALKGNFREATELKIWFPEEPSWVFERFQLWLYSKQILDEGETASSLNYRELEALYVFAESRCITKLQNHLLDLLIQKSDIEHSIALPGRDLEGTGSASSSPVQKLLVDFAAYKGKFRKSCPLQDCPKGYLVDLVRVLSGIRDVNATMRKDFWGGRCEYHIHAEGEPRCSGGSEEQNMIRTLTPSLLAHRLRMRLADTRIRLRRPDSLVLDT